MVRSSQNAAPTPQRMISICVVKILSQCLLFFLLGASRTDQITAASLGEIDCRGPAVPHHTSQSFHQLYWGGRQPRIQRKKKKRTETHTHTKKLK